jgi:hypothetical protein
MPDNEARGCSSLFPRHLYIPPPPPRVRVRRRRASPEQIEEWLRKHFPEGGLRDPAVRACCRELRAPTRRRSCDLGMVISRPPWTTTR